PVQLQSGSEQQGRAYLRIADERHVVAMYVQAAGSAGNELATLVQASRLGAPALALGAPDNALPQWQAVPESGVRVQGFAASHGEPVRLRGAGNEVLRAHLLHLDYPAAPETERPWM